MYGLNIDPLNPKGNPDGNALRNLGVEFVRYVYKDSSAGGRPDPARVDFYRQKVEALAKADIQTLLILNSESYPGNPWSSAPDPEWEVYLNGFAERAGQIAGIMAPWRPAIQVWNEPDFPPQPGYDPAVRPPVFGRMLTRVYEAVKVAAPGLPVIAGGLASGHPAWLGEVVRTLEGQFPAEAMAVHPYTKRPNPDWPDPSWGTGYVGDLLNGYRQVINRPIWITEIGTKDLEAEGQAEYLRRFYRAMTNQFGRFVEQVFWFCYSDNMVPPFGLLDVGDNPKPAYLAYDEVTPAPPPIDPPASSASASHNNVQTGEDSIRRAFDGRPETRWSTRRPQQPGMWFWIDLGQVRGVRGLALDTAGSANDFPRGYAVFLSEDGQQWNEVARNDANDRALAIAFQTQPVRHIYVEQTGRSDIWWWSIHEVIITEGPLPDDGGGPGDDEEEPPAALILSLSASHNGVEIGPDNLNQAIDGQPETRWSSRLPQRPGMWFQIELAQVRSVTGLALDTAGSPSDYPRGYAVFLAEDDQQWQEVERNPDNERALDLTFSPRRARYIRIEQIGSSNVWWWSIHGLTIR